MTREQLIAGLEAGRTAVVDRRDAPELPILLEMEREGLVTSKLVEYDEQSSALKFKWAALEKRNLAPTSVLSCRSGGSL
jgi:hypothetical protein